MEIRTKGTFHGAFSRRNGDKRKLEMEAVSLLKFLEPVDGWKAGMASGSVILPKECYRHVVRTRIELSDLFDFLNEGNQCHFPNLAA